MRGDLGMLCIDKRLWESGQHQEICSIWTKLNSQTNRQGELQRGFNEEFDSSRIGAVTLSSTGFDLDE